MTAEKTKIRISRVVSLIIDHDCVAFGFETKESSPNRNGFLNQLIPNLLTARKERRDKIKHVLHDDFGRKDAETIYEAVNTVIDQVYFEDKETEKLDFSLWLRPDKSSKSAFDEIRKSELKITCQDYSSYIRGLLNEYSRFPLYERQALTFRKERLVCKEAFETGKTMQLSYKGKDYRVRFYAILYGFLSIDETNYIIALDISTREIRSFDLSFAKSLFLTQETYLISKSERKALQSYAEKHNFSDDNVEKIK